ncbi:recombinase family protein (plasmid) [Aerococcus urinaeequi]|uniref:Recombinase family protein n=1 Tax=Aerococcus urinaeequi TaxID=51665 RepID=A0AA47GD78_9LACT|nr:recombinase family protein [Aerococcus urinaeequi]WAT25565.1 recombinase family protein [Aerococcus urinaeequi]
MIYGYARVSTRKQDLKIQIDTLKAHHCEKIYQETISGRSTDRPAFKKLMKDIQKGDTLVITKLDRLARSTQEALKVIKYLFENQITIDILNMGKIENTPTGRLIFTIFSAFADFERDLIVERTQEGKEIARNNPNFKDGRPIKYSKQQIQHALSLLNTYSYNQVQEMTGISKSTLWRYKKKQDKI